MAVVGEVVATAGVPEPELTVVAHLDKSGGMLRQSALAAATGWDRTRLSHLLTRMEARDLVARERVRNGVEVRLLPAGQAVVQATLPHLEVAVRRHLLDPLTEDDRRALHDIIARLLAGTPRRVQRRARGA